MKFQATTAAMKKPKLLDVHWSTLSCMKIHLKSIFYLAPKEYKKRLVQMSSSRESSLPLWSQRSNSHRKNRKSSQTSLQCTAFFRFSTALLPFLLAELRHQHGWGSILEGPHHLHFRINLQKTKKNVFGRKMWKKMLLFGVWRKNLEIQGCFRKKILSKTSVAPDANCQLICIVH